MPLPSRFGRYEILTVLGQGGMGAVYKARDPDIDRIVALKTINPALLATRELRDEYMERFRREARAAGRLSHPHIVSVYDLGLDEATATPFIVMEYVAGVSLEEVLKENPSLPVEQALEIVEQVASALEEAHRNGVVHRDVKPANVFLDARGRVKVGDFGVARLEGSELTDAGVGLGTPGYAAPEVLRGGPADARSDVFALGVLAYRLLTGKRPFVGATREAMAIDIMEQVPPAPDSVRPEVPAAASTAIMRALSKSPGDRIPTAEAFASELRGTAPMAGVPPPAVTTRPTPAPPVAALRPPAPVTAAAVTAVPVRTVTVATIPRAPAKRRRLLVAALIAAALALGVAAFLATRGTGVPEPPGAAGTVPARDVQGASPRPVRSAAIPAARPQRSAPVPGGQPPLDGGKVDEVLRETQKKVEERLREEWKKATERAKEDDKKAREEKKRGERGRDKGKKGRSKGRDGR